MRIQFVLLLILLISFNSVSAQETPEYEVITIDNVADLQLIAARRGRIDDMEWSPDSTTLAVAGLGGLWLYNPSDLTQPTRMLYSDFLTSVAYSEDGRYLSAGMFSFTMQQGGQFGADKLIVWDMQSLEVVFETTASVVNMMFFPNSRLLLTLNNAGGLEVWDVEAHERLAHGSYVVRAGTSVGYGDIVLSISPEGTYFSGSSYYLDEASPVWSTQQIIEQQEITRENVLSNVIVTDEWLNTPILHESITSPSGDLQVSTDSLQQQIIISDAKTMQEISSLYMHLDNGFSVYRYSDNQRILIWDPPDFELEDIDIPSETLSSRQVYSPNGQLLAAKPFENENQIDLWDTSSRSLRTSYKVVGEPGTASSFAFTSDNRYLLVASQATGTDYGNLTIIDLLSDEIITELTTDKILLDIAVSPDDLSFALLLRSQDSMNSQVQIWELSGITTEQNPSMIWDFDFLTNSLLYVTDKSLVLEREFPSGTTTLSLFDFEMGVERFFEGNDEASLNLTDLYSPSFNVDRTLLAAATPNGIRFWDLASLAEVASIDTDRVVYVSFHRDGKTLISVHGEDLNGDLRLWSIPSVE